MSKVFCQTLVAAIMVAATGAFAQEPPSLDAHALFEGRCLSCHGHAGTFSREHLALGQDGAVAIRSGHPVGPFLTTHAGGLSEQEIDALLTLFDAQLQAEDVFQQKCRICHNRAYDLARLYLIERDGRLIGRYTGRDIATFVRAHGRLDQTEAQDMADVLRYLLAGSR